MRSFIPVVVALAWLGACGGKAPQQDPKVARDSIRADSVALADSVFSPAAFDTIKWKSKAEAIERGSLVFKISCVRCHGDGGGGRTNVVFQGDTLNPPSFLGKDWALATDTMGLRKKIFSGNVAGMPHWGLIGLHYRDVDAVARYITDFLRPNYGEK